MALGEGEVGALSNVMLPAAAHAVGAVQEQRELLELEGERKQPPQPCAAIPAPRASQWCTWNCRGIRHEGLEQINAVNLEFEWLLSGSRRWGGGLCPLCHTGEQCQ